MADTQGASAEEARMFEEQVGRIKRAVSSEPLHRELYVGMLEFCKERRSLGEVEEMTLAAPQAAQMTQSPCRLAKNLSELGALLWVGLDEDGLEVTPQRTEGLSAEEAEDLVATWALLTTEAGVQASEELSPSTRLDELVAETPGREGAFAEVLAFCEEPRSIRELSEHLDASGILDVLLAQGGQPLRASYFVDMLERAGGLVWDGAWHTTPGGRGLLERIAGSVA